MTTPHQPYLPSRILLTCPDCSALMRIETIEVDDGHEHVKLVCDECRTEATLDALSKDDSEP